MKKYIFITMLLILSACTFTKQQKAEKLIKKYLDSSLNDPKSYESVSFSEPIKLKDTIIKLGETFDTVRHHGDFLILHTYRAKNAFGAVIKSDEWFKIDSALTRAQCCFTEPE
jgi:hypothetical protein